LFYGVIGSTAPRKLINQLSAFSSPSVSYESLADAVDLNHLQLKSVPTGMLIKEALVLANECNPTACDACYAVLARQLEIPLITAGEQAVRSVKRV